MEYQLNLEACSGARTWYARVPTEANLSDFPSRMQPRDLLLEERNVSSKALTELARLFTVYTTLWRWSYVKRGKRDDSSPFGKVSKSCLLELPCHAQPHGTLTVQLVKRSNSQT